MALIDFVSEVSTITKSYIPDDDMQSLDIPVTVRAVGDYVVSYLGIDVDYNPDIGHDSNRLFNKITNHLIIEALLWD